MCVRAQGGFDPTTTIIKRAVSFSCRIIATESVATADRVTADRVTAAALVTATLATVYSCCLRRLSRQCSLAMSVLLVLAPRALGGLRVAA